MFDTYNCREVDFNLMSAKLELQGLKGRLEDKIRALRMELETVDKAIALLDRETPKPAEAPKIKGIGNMGVTDAIRSMIAFEFVTPLQVRDALTKSAFSYPNGAAKLLNVVWATMQRLAESPAYEVGKVDGKFAVKRRSSTGQLPLAEGQIAGVQNVH